MGALKNPKHEKFVQALLAGKSQRVAYREAFPNSESWKDETVDSKACVLAKDDKILERLQELQNASASDAILDRQGRMLILTEIATNDEMMPKARMQAIDILNKMDGDYVKRVEAVVTGDLSDTAAKVAAILDE